MTTNTPRQERIISQEATTSQGDSQSIKGGTLAFYLLSIESDKDNVRYWLKRSNVRMELTGY
jgi:hypothetical protein